MLYPSSTQTDEALLNAAACFGLRLMGLHFEKDLKTRVLHPIWRLQGLGSNIRIPGFYKLAPLGTSTALSQSL